MDDTLPLVDSATLPDAEKKRLRNSHPLYGRMNGEVIWMAYEELGYDAEACATVMDAELDLRHRTVSLMATLEQSPDACCVLELPDAPCASCTACPNLTRLAIDAATPQWRQWLRLCGCHTCRLYSASIRIKRMETRVIRPYRSIAFYSQLQRGTDDPRRRARRCH